MNRFELFSYVILNINKTTFFVKKVIKGYRRVKKQLTSTKNVFLLLKNSKHDIFQTIG